MNKRLLLRLGKHAFLEWDRFQVDLQYTPKMPKPALARLTSNHILRLPNMTTWGVGAIPLNVHAKLECNEDLAIIIRAIQAG